MAGRHLVARCCPAAAVHPVVRAPLARAHVRCATRPLPPARCRRAAWWSRPAPSQRRRHSTAAAAGTSASADAAALERAGEYYGSLLRGGSWLAVLNIIDRYRALAAKEQEPTLSRAEYTEVAQSLSKLEPAEENARQELLDLEVLISDGGDAELVAVARDDRRAVVQRLQEAETRMLSFLVPLQFSDSRNAVLEVRAGAGGEEAALFTADLFRLYEKYAVLRGWRFQLMTVSDAEAGGFKDATALISGTGVFGLMKYEIGTHRIQRVPQTETKGRVHTSTMTVVVMPEAQEADVAIHDNDLRIDTYRSSGPGGQNVNKTDSAVRITHLPSGLVVACQNERSQTANKKVAMHLLRAKLFEREQQRLDTERTELRRSQIGSAERSERVRTFNIAQSRVTDHRVNVSKALPKDPFGAPGADVLAELAEALQRKEQVDELERLYSQ